MQFPIQESDAHSMEGTTGDPQIFNEGHHMVAPLVPKVRLTERYQKILYNGYLINTRVFSFRASGFNQKPPFIRTAFNVAVHWTLKGQRDATSWNTTYQQQVDNCLVPATNRAYAKMVGKLGDTSQFGSSLTGERRQTFNLVTSTVINLAKAARAVKKGQLGKAANILGVEPPIEKVVFKTSRRKGRRVRRVPRTVYVLPSWQGTAKSFGNKWLWYSYGAKPLIEDVYNGMDVLQRPLPWETIRGSASETRFVVTQNSSSYYMSYGVTSRVTQSCDVRVSNPNLWLMNQMGLVNPAQWLLEGTPLSFIVDWFSNLSDVVNSMTDFVGLEIEQPVTASKTVLDYVGYNRYNWAPINDASSHKTKSTLLVRELKLTKPKLRFAYERFQWQRGLNAISLLVQLLKAK